MRPESVQALGTIARARLWEDGAVILFLNRSMQVECVPLSEVRLDASPEEDAIRALQARNYDDEQLVSYLKGRDARNQLK